MCENYCRTTHSAHKQTLHVDSLRHRDAQDSNTRVRACVSRHAAKLSTRTLLALNNNDTHTQNLSYHQRESREERNLCDYRVVSNRDFRPQPRLITREALTFC